MARPMKPLVRGGGYYPSNGWTPLVYAGGYTTANGGEEPAPPPIEKTVTGNPIHILDALAKPAQALSVKLEPIQDLHGYDNPWPAGGGKNLFNVSSGQSATTRGVTATYDGTNGLIYSGSPTDVGFIGSWVLPTPLTLTAGTYSISIKTPVNFRFCIVSSWANVADILSSQNKKTFTLSETKTIDRLCLVLDDSSIVGTPINVHIEDIQIETGSTATAFAPYSNICPISGHTDADVTRTGKNLLDTKNFAPTASSSGGITTVQNQNGTFAASGTASGVVNLWLRGNYGASNPVLKLYAGKRYIIKDVMLYRGTIQVTPTCYIGSAVTYSPRNDVLITGVRASTPKGTTLDTTIYPYVTDSADTEWQEFGTTYPIPLGTTVYGGTLDVTQGKLTVDRAMVDLGTLSFVKSATYSGRFFAHFPTNKPPIPYNGSRESELPKLICSSYAAKLYTDIWEGGEIGISQFISSGFDNVGICDTRYSDAQSFMDSIGGQTLVYYLRTPFEVQLTPTEITTLLGTNNVWSDGTMTLVYLADGNASDTEALNILLGGRYVNNHGEDEPTDREALDIVLGGKK